MCSNLPQLYKTHFIGTPHTRVIFCNHSVHKKSKCKNLRNICAALTNTINYEWHLKFPYSLKKLNLLDLFDCKGLSSSSAPRAIREWSIPASRCPTMCLPSSAPSLRTRFAVRKTSNIQHLLNQSPVFQPWTSTELNASCYVPSATHICLHKRDRRQTIGMVCYQSFHPSPAVKEKALGVPTH